MYKLEKTSCFCHFYHYILSKNLQICYSRVWEYIICLSMRSENKHMLKCQTFKDLKTINTPPWRHFLRPKVLLKVLEFLFPSYYSWSQINSQRAPINQYESGISEKLEKMTLGKIIIVHDHTKALYHGLSTSFSTLSINILESILKNPIVSTSAYSVLMVLHLNSTKRRLTVSCIDHDMNVFSKNKYKVTNLVQIISMCHQGLK